MPTSPTSGPGGGGGSASAPLVLTGTAPNSTPLTVVGDPLQSADLIAFEDDNGHYGLNIATDGAGAIGDVELQAGDNSTLFLSCASSVRVGNQNATNPCSIQGAQVNISSTRVVFSGQVAAPADAVFDNSTFALWLDATPGATKLMVKAKDSGGTVRSAAIALS